MQIKNTNTIAGDGRKKMMVYGRSGVGKTYFCAKFPKPIFLAAEEGMLTLAGQGISYIPIKKWNNEVEEAYQFLNSPKARKKYKTVVIDSLTELQMLCLAHVLEKSGKEAMEIQQWGRLLDMMRKFVREMTDLPYDIIFICRETDTKDERTGIVKTLPGLMGKFAEEAPAYVDICMRLHMDEPRREGESATRFGMFQPSARYDAKDRTGALPSVMKEPSAKKVLSRIDKRFAELEKGKVNG